MTLLNMSLSSPHPPEGVGMDVAKIQINWELNVLGGKKMKIKCEILATFRNNPYLCTVKCMFDYPGRIPRGASLIDNALGARHHDTTPFLKPSPQGMVFYRSYAFLNIWKNASPIVIWRITEIRLPPLKIRTSTAWLLISK